MAQIVLALFLLVFGLNILVGISIPLWILGVLAVAAGGLLLAERLGLGFTAKK